MISELMSVRAEAATSSTARSKAARLPIDGLVKPLSLRTNWSEAARISSSVAGGAKLNSVLMLRHTGVASYSRVNNAVVARRGLACNAQILPADMLLMGRNALRANWLPGTRSRWEAVVSVVR